MSDTTSLDSLHQRVVQELWSGKRALLGLTTAAGSTSSLVMASLANSSQSTNAYDGVGIYFKSVTAEPKESYVTRAGFTAASGTFAMSPAYGSSPGSGVTGYFLYGLTMAQIDEAINNVIRTLHLPRYRVLTSIDDGDMESSALTSWLDSTGTPTQTKETSIVLTGTQSLKLVYTVLDDSVRSLSLPVTEGDVFNFSSAIKCTAGSLRAQVYDVTNSAEIWGTTVDEEDWTEVRSQQFTIPNNCQNIQVRYIAKTASTTAYVDYAAIYSSRSTYALPSGLDAGDVLGIMRLPQGFPSEASNAYMAFSEVLRPWPYYGMLRDYAGATSHRIEIQQPSIDPLFVYFRAPDAVLAQNTNDTDTTFAPVQVVVDGAVSDCLSKLYAATGETDYKRRAMEYQRKYNNALEGIGLGKPTTSRRPVSRVMAI